MSKKELRRRASRYEVYRSLIVGEIYPARRIDGKSATYIAGVGSPISSEHLLFDNSATRVSRGVARAQTRGARAAGFRGAKALPSAWRLRLRAWSRRGRGARAGCSGCLCAAHQRTTLSSTSPMTPFPAGGGPGRVSAALFGAVMIRARPWSEEITVRRRGDKDLRLTTTRPSKRVEPRVAASAPTTARPGALS